MERYHFPYTGGNPFKGVFEYMRLNPLFSRGNAVKVSSGQSVINDMNQFCADGYYGGEASVLIDGNSASAWANSEFKESQAFFSVEFMNKSFKLINFSFKTVCQSPKTISIRGSNNGITYYPVSSESKNFKEYSTYTLGTQYPNYYKHYKIAQTGTNSGGIYRMHLSEIEFFGYFSQKLSMNRRILNIYISRYFPILIGLVINC